MFICYFLLVVVATVNGQQEGDACVEQFTKAAGICKPVAQCETARQDLQESGIRPTFCSRAVFGDALVCCRDGLTIFETPASVARTKDLSTSAQRKRVSERKCEEYSREVVQRVDYLLLFLKPEVFSISIDQCKGRTASLPGEAAEPGEFPHMVALGWKDLKNKYDFMCGGSLISANFVLTTAKCGRLRHDHVQPNIVRLGDQNLDDSVHDGVTPIDIYIRRVLTHPDYKPPEVYNDIALIELASVVEFSAIIRPACLWTKSHFHGYDKVISTGWNLFNPNGTSQEKELKKAPLNLVENNFCDSLLYYIKNRNWQNINDFQLCAGEMTEVWDSCLNESGSPLQVTSKENQCVFYIIAITSFGAECKKAQNASPKVHTRVSAYLDWIEQVVWPDEK